MRPRPYSCTPEPLIHAASGVFRALTRLCARRPACLRPGCLGMKKERRSPRRPFPVKICENSRPPSRRPCPLSLDIPGFSHVLPSCPALSRFSQLSCLFTAENITYSIDATYKSPTPAGMSRAIQLGTPFYITIEGEAKLGGFWNLDLVNITVVARGSGVSEHYWK